MWFFKKDILAVHLHETIGLALDLKKEVVYVTDLAGGVYSVHVSEGQHSKQVLFSELGDLTGIAVTNCSL